METAHVVRPLSIADLFGFLVGRHDSIVNAARDPSTFWISLILVFAAALAREYDGEDLLHEPWHLLIPVVASVAVSLPLFMFVRRTSTEGRPSFFIAYRAFLGLFWLTAPLAVLYAIPYERFLSAADAVRANLWTLAAVSLWRGFLTARFISVITGLSFTASFVRAAFVANVFAFFALLLAPRPVLQVMGGVRLTEAEQALQSVGMLAQLGTVTAFPILAILAWLSSAERRENVERLTSDESLAHGKSGRTPWIAASLLVLVFMSLLPLTQPAQQRRHTAERLLDEGDLVAAIADMSRHARTDYPPHWDPPPRIGWPGPERPKLLSVLNVIADQGSADWVRGIYLDKLERSYLSTTLHFMEPDEWETAERILDRLPEGQSIRTQYADRIGNIRRNLEYVQAMTTMPATTQAVP